ncbi:MAG: cytochrome ubiquinol oxidase subunit I, partial [Bryobacterales bacterium]|nr:cytochrome ubiquinol oxidase subunit I [Bryobacteraceae bacterium]MDW8129133.1 cytochrome ubiquinol oxidase subunit I [Bryobacterales bacterium]
LLFGEKRLSRKAHWAVSLLLWLGTWLSAYFILATNAFMQHPVGYKILPGGELQLESLGSLLLNPWLGWMFLHNQFGTVVTAGFVMASIGAFYLLSDRHVEYGRTFVRLGVIAAGVASILMLFPTGDMQVRNVAKYQPVTLAAMEGLFETMEGAPIAILGQPDMEKMRLDNPLLVPRMLSFLTYRRWTAEVKGLDAFPRDQWPDQVPLLYYAYHIMVGLGTIFIAVSLVSLFKLRRGTLFASRRWLWVLLLMAPFPFIANTAGWMTAEMGRQPWLVYGVMRTSEGASYNVSSGNALFTLIGFMGMYAVLSILFLYLSYREVDHGPEPAAQPSAS